MYLDLDQLAEAATPPLDSFLRLAEAALDGAEQLTAASLDASRRMVEAGGASLLLMNAGSIWPQEALALQSARRGQALQKVVGHYRRMLGMPAEAATPSGSATAENSQEPAQRQTTAVLRAATSGAALAALQSVWVDTASAFGSLQYCPALRHPEKTTP